MRSYALRRLLLIVPTLLLVTIIVFCGMRLIPGDIIDVMISQNAGVGTLTQEQQTSLRTELKQQLGMDGPIYEQYGVWLGKALRGDLGKSLWDRYSVTDSLTARLPVTAELALFAMLSALLLGLPIGIFSAVRQDTPGDYVARTFSILCIALPSFWLGILVIVYPSVWWGWTPPLQLIPFTRDPLGNIMQFLIPGFILGMVLSGTIMRMTRTMMLEVLRQDYIRTAWSKGLVERVVIIRHALKNALIPVVTIAGTSFSFLIGGSVVIENIFALPGLGALLVDALSKRDYTVVSGLNLFIGASVLLLILLIDLSYAWLDPRIHYK